MNDLNTLGFIQRDAALSHFLGGCRSVLQHGGAITRKDFVQLIHTATDFGKRTKL